ncbi:MAG: uncharacterized protein QOI64_661 [Solirubrobacteraceae bacterium]|nr:uncharacterized protein [Solirubrobacteraceae bacterium]
MSHLRSIGAAGAVVIASAACAAPAAAQTPGPPAPQPPPTVTVTGSGTVKPSPLNRRSEASIAKSVRDAKATATPLAIADGRTRAANLAAQAGLVIGPLLGISEGGSGAPPFFFSPFGQEGTFGPGKFCGTVRTPIYRKTADGKRKRVGVRTRHACRVPTQVTASLAMTFASAPAPTPAPASTPAAAPAPAPPPGGTD